MRNCYTDIKQSILEENLIERYQRNINIKYKYKIASTEFISIQK